MKAKWIDTFTVDEALSLQAETAEEEEALKVIRDHPNRIVQWYKEQSCRR